MKTKAQIAGQVFVYILAIFVFAVILLYGYSAIKGFIEKGEETAFIQFKNTLEGEVSRIYTEPGDIIVFNERSPLTVPGDYKSVCFIDYRTTTDTVAVPEWLDGDTKQILLSAVDAGVHTSTENVFTIPPAQSPIYLGYIETSPSIFCVNITKGLLNIRIEGLGYGTKIS